MTITTSVVSVGTAQVTLCSPTIDAQDAWVENLEPSNNLGDFSRDGYTYVVDELISIAGNGTAIFSFTTGDTGAQFDFWSFQTENTDVFATLWEGATITTTGTAIPAYNLNRNASDSYDAVLESATAISGGTAILSEYIGASFLTSGSMQSSKIVTLRPNTEYGFTFQSRGGATTDVHIQIGWVEKYNGYNDVWLNGIQDQAVRLRGGEKIQLALQQGEGITAVASRDGVQVAVMRQD